MEIGLPSLFLSKIYVKLSFNTEQKNIHRKYVSDLFSKYFYLYNLDHSLHSDLSLWHKCQGAL